MCEELGGGAFMITYTLPRLHGDARPCEDDFWGRPKVLYTAKSLEIIKNNKKGPREMGFNDNCEVERPQILSEIEDVSCL